MRPDDKEIMFKRKIGQVWNMIKEQWRNKTIFGRWKISIEKLLNIMNHERKRETNHLFYIEDMMGVKHFLLY